MLKIQKIYQEVNCIANQLTPKQQAGFKVGVRALSLRRIVSLNHAGRFIEKDPRRKPSGMCRIHRLVADTKLADQLQEVLIQRVMLNQSRGKALVNINLDHSQVGNFTVAFAAKQTRSSRGMPFWAQVNEGFNNAVIAPLVDELQALIDKLKTCSLGVEICLVGDRWFGSHRLMELAEKNKVFFLFRSKDDKWLETILGRQKINDISSYDSLVEYKGLRCRLVMSRLREGMQKPWWLLTNDFESSYKSLLFKYRQRWQIESNFRDLKHSQGLKKTRLRKAAHLRAVLLFAFLGWSLLYSSVVKKALFQTLRSFHIKKRQSWFNYLFEMVEDEQFVFT